MALPLYLAMTAAEIQNCTQFPGHTAWMACHFSAYANGISNIPNRLPAGSALILNDRIPPQGHDPRLVAAQLAQAVEQLSVRRVLLDFQRPDLTELAAVTQAVTETLPCPVAVTTQYAKDLPCPVFLYPQLHKPLQEQLQAFFGREIWLEAATDCLQITVTAEGSRFCSVAPVDDSLFCHRDETLHCRYFTQITKDWVRFTLLRDPAALQALLQQADSLGVTCAFGLYQQLGEKETPQT